MRVVGIGSRDDFWISLRTCSSISVTVRLLKTGFIGRDLANRQTSTTTMILHYTKDRIQRSRGSRNHPAKRPSLFSPRDSAGRGAATSQRDLLMPVGRTCPATVNHAPPPGRTRERVHIRVNRTFNVLNVRTYTRCMYKRARDTGTGFAPWRCTRLFC